LNAKHYQAAIGTRYGPVSSSALIGGGVVEESLSTTSRPMPVAPGSPMAAKPLGDAPSTGEPAGGDLVEVGAGLVGVALDLKTRLLEALRQL